MKLYECLKKVIEKNKIFSIPVEDSKIDMKFAIVNKKIYTYTETDNKFIATSFFNQLWVIYEDCEILDTNLEENKIYYEALRKFQLKIYKKGKSYE